MDEQLEYYHSFREIYTSDDAKAAYDKVDKPKAVFDSWAIDNYPALETAETTVEGVTAAYEQIMMYIQGSGWQDLSDKIKKLRGATNATRPSARA